MFMFGIIFGVSATDGSNRRLQQLYKLSMREEGEEKICKCQTCPALADMPRSMH